MYQERLDTHTHTKKKLTEKSYQTAIDSMLALLMLSCIFSAFGTLYILSQLFALFLSFWHTLPYFLSSWHTLHTFSAFCTLSSFWHTFSYFHSFWHSLSAFGTLSNSFSAFGTLSYTFSAFGTLSQLLAHFCHLLEKTKPDLLLS